METVREIYESQSAWDTTNMMLEIGARTGAKPRIWWKLHLAAVVSALPLYCHCLGASSACSMSKTRLGETS